METNREYKFNSQYPVKIIRVHSMIKRMYGILCILMTLSGNANSQ